MGDIEEMISRGNEVFKMAIKTNNKYYYEESIKIYEKVIEKSPYLPRVLTDLGTALNRIGNYKESIIRYTQSIKSNKNNPDNLKSITFYNLGRVNQFLEKYPEALKNYESSIMLDRNHYRPYNAIGSIRDLSGEFIEAIFRYKEALNLCTNKEISKLIKNNIKNSNNNMKLFLKNIGNRALNDEIFCKN